jgi:hypothetical protein
MRRLPTGTVTFLFTDIEGSTKLLPASDTRFDYRRLCCPAIARREECSKIEASAP